MTVHDSDVAAPATPAKVQRDADPIPFRSALWLGAALGLLSGIGEIGLLGVAKFVLGRYSHLNPQIVWMAPLLYALLFATMAALLFAVRAVWRSLPVYRAIVLVSAFVGSAGILFLLTRLHKGAALLLALGLAVQAMILSTRIRGWVIPRARRLAVIFAAFPFIAFLGLNGGRVLGERFGLAPPPASMEGVHNVLLIIWDTMRAASSSLYGYERDTTPSLERLAARGVVFERAFSTAPWTLPAHASMFTGMGAGELEADWGAPLEEGPTTIAAALLAGGYRTGGFVANRFYVSHESGLHRGFLRYEVYPVFSVIEFVTSSTLGRAIFNDVGWRRRLGMRQKPGRKYGEQVSDEFLSWVGDSPSERPFFAFLNYFDAHHPYLPPPPFDTLFGPLLPGRDPAMEEDRPFTPRELQAEIDAYDGGIAYDDRELGRLLDALERRGLLDNTLVIVTSDHGEEFGEHEVFTHGNSLYDPALHVPLVLSGPGIPAGGRIREWVSTRDIAATVADITGIRPDRPLGGASLGRFWTPSPRTDPDTLLAAVSHSRGHPARYPVSHGDMDAVLAAPYKYIRNGDGSEELYHLPADPGELEDLHASPALQAVVARLRSYLTSTGW